MCSCFIVYLYLHELVLFAQLLLLLHLFPTIVSYTFYCQLYGSCCCYLGVRGCYCANNRIFCKLLLFFKVFVPSVSSTYHLAFACSESVVVGLGLVVLCGFGLQLINHSDVIDVVLVSLLVSHVTLVVLLLTLGR